MNKLPFAAPMYWVLGEDGRTPEATDDVYAWAKCMSDLTRKHVGWDFSNDKGITVSTVFLGIDHGYTGGPPVLFETMIFGGPKNDYQARYCTWDEAERGHALACELAGIQRKLQTWIDGEQADET